MMGKCQICNADFAVNPENCPICGWEQVVIPDSASERLKKAVNTKMMVYKSYFDRFKNAVEANSKLQAENSQLKEKLEETSHTQQLPAGRQLCMLTEHEEVILLNAGDLTFGRLGPSTGTHFVFSSDREMDSRHFAMQINYNLPDGSLFSCKIRTIGSKATFVNGTRKIGADWEDMDANDEIMAGRTKLKLVLTK